MKKNPYIFRCVIMGASSVGKSSIMARYIHNKFNDATIPTIGSAYNSKTFDMPQGKVKLEIWDTAGQERFDSLTPLYYRNADIIVLVYDITSKESYDRAIRWYHTTKDIQPTPGFILVGNKSDMKENRYNETKQLAERFAEQNYITFIECSALTGQNVNLIFENSRDIALANAAKNSPVYEDIVILEEQTTANYSCFGTIISYPLTAVDWTKSYAMSYFKKPEESSDFDTS